MEYGFYIGMSYGLTIVVLGAIALVSCYQADRGDDA